MKKPTTVEGWLMTLPEPLRSSALKYCDARYTLANCLSDAILKFALWSKVTDNGKDDSDFWSSFYEALIWAESKEG